MDSIVNHLENFCISQGFDRTYWVGYSGGLDSQVLLHLLVELRLRYPLKLHAVHIHHGLSPAADSWAQRCATWCAQWQVDFSLRTISAHHFQTESPEEFARDLRYQAFAKLLAPHDCLLTAHHQDDQAETLLLQMLRGAGPKGLAAMPVLKKYAQGYHARPLLPVTRDELKNYAEQNRLTWIEDESNGNVNFTRNFLRHEVLPILKKRWPSVTNTLARVAENCAEAQQLVEEMATQDLASVKGLSANTLSVDKLAQLTPVRQRQVIRTWLQRLNFPIPSAVKMQQIQRDMLQAREDKSPHFIWRGIELRRYRDDLYAMPRLEKHDATQVYEWDLSKPLNIPGVGMLSVGVIGKSDAEHTLHPDIQQVTVCFRQGGEQLQLPGRQHHHSIKKLFQEWGIPPWERTRVPFIYVGNRLVAIVGYYGVKNLLLSSNS